MALFKRKQHAVADIVLSSKAGGDSFNSTPDHFLSHETISGYAQFTLPAADKFSHAEITLKGKIRITTEQRSNGRISKDRQTESLSFLGTAFGSNARNKAAGGDSTGATIRRPFRFDLLECEKLAEFVSSLPPSLDSKQEGDKASNSQYEVTYIITATAFADSGLLASATQKVYIDPVLPDSMSDASSDELGEYFWSTKHSRGSRSGASSPSQPRIDLAGQEPHPLTLNADNTSQGGQTDISFTVKASAQTNGKLPEASLPQMAHVSSRLVTKTYLTPEGLKGIPASMHLDYIRVDGPTTTSVHYSDQQSCDIAIADWIQPEHDCADHFAVARFSLPFKLDPAKIPSPSFLTPLLSRRYLIEMRVTFDGSDDTYDVSVPCEIIHESATANDVYEDTSPAGPFTGVTEIRLSQAVLNTA